MVCRKRNDWRRYIGGSSCADVKAGLAGQCAFRVEGKHTSFGEYGSRYSWWCYVYGAVVEAMYVPFEVLGWEPKTSHFVFCCCSSVEFVLQRLGG